MKRERYRDRFEKLNSLHVKALADLLHEYCSATTITANGDIFENEENKDVFGKVEVEEVTATAANVICFGWT